MSGARKRWISAEVDAGLVAQLEREALARGISRSEAVRKALLDWTREAMEEDEERITRYQANHRQLMRRLDFVVGMIREQDRRLVLLAGREVVGDHRGRAAHGSGHVAEAQPAGPLLGENLSGRDQDLATPVLVVYVARH